MRRLLFLTAFILTVPVISHAQDYKTLLDLPEGASLVNLSAMERIEVDQDLLVASLNFEAQNKDAKALQDEINKTMQKAVETAKAVKDVKLSTQQYYVYPFDYDPNPQPVEKGQLPGKLTRIWKGSQGLELKSKNSTALLKLVGELQTLGLSVNGLSYTISPELAEETQNSLLESALAKLKIKAERTAKALGKSKADLLQINVDTGGYYPQPMMARGMAMDSMSKGEMAPVAPPVAEAGQSEITLTVSAQAILKP